LNSQIVYLINSPTAPRSQSFNASGESVYLWGGQFEASKPTPPRTSPHWEQRLRAWLTLRYKTGISSLIGQTEGTLFVDVIVQVTGASQSISVSDGTASNRIDIRLTGANYIAGVGVIGGVVQFSITGTTFTQGQRLKIALAYSKPYYSRPALSNAFQPGRP
jgi:hypothetical protein